MRQKKLHQICSGSASGSDQQQPDLMNSCSQTNLRSKFNTVSSQAVWDHML